MRLSELVEAVADELKAFDSVKPIHKSFQPGVGPFGEPQLVRELATRFVNRGWLARTRRTPDMEIGKEWAIEFKLARPFGDNGKEAENWSVNLLHPYEGNTSLIGDGFKLGRLAGYEHGALIVVGFEHDPPRISLEPLLQSFELLAQNVARLPLGPRVDSRRAALVHPVHQVLICAGWELMES